MLFRSLQRLAGRYCLEDPGNRRRRQGLRRDHNLRGELQQLQVRRESRLRYPGGDHPAGDAAGRGIKRRRAAGRQKRLNEGKRPSSRAVRCRFGRT